MSNEPTEDQILQWTTALRSGKYRQTKENLQDDNGYCCLGVACDVFVPQFQLDVDSKLQLKYSLPEDQVHAPTWLKNVNQDFYTRTDRSLVNLNDNGVKYFEGYELEPFSFDEIADLLEAVYIHKVLES